MFFGEQADGSISELKLQDFTFLENDFPKRGHITSDLDLFEIEESDTSIAPLQPIHRFKMNMRNFIPVVEKGIFRFLEKDNYTVVNVSLFLDVILISRLKL